MLLPKSALNAAALAAPMAVWLSLWSLPSASATPSLAQELARCAAVTAADSRLGCYDALAQRTQGDSAENPSGRTDDARSFGLSPVQIHPAPVGPVAIDARLAGIAFNQGEMGLSYLQLDNGQIWKTRDDVARLTVGEQVKIKRAALGSFLLLNPANLSYRVYRVK
jgi:hypothetical protein